MANTKTSAKNNSDAKKIKELNIMLYIYLGVFRYAYPQIYKTIRRPMF